MGTAQPNKAHQVLGDLENKGIIKGIITQNIDGLHQAAGSKNVVEFHGTINTLACIDCNLRFKISEIDMSQDIPKCPSCNGILKPDFVFYGEGINKNNYDKATNMAIKADLVIIVGTSGQVMPACYLPFTSQKYGAKIIEVNTLESAFTAQITDYYFQTKATDFFSELEKYF